MFKNIILLITAAGKSSRMGIPKGLIQIQNRPLIQHHIDNFRKAFSNAEIRVVIGHHAEEYKEFQTQVILIMNENYQQGQFSSIQAGLRNIHDIESAKVFLQPVDLAPISPDVYISMLNVSKNKEIIKPKWNNSSGHPILLQGKILSNIVSANSNNRLDLMLRSVDQKLIKWQLVNSPNITTNLNNLEDIATIIQEE